MTEKTTETSPRIWVGSLADYNAGRLLGEWLELEEYSDVSELEEDIQRRVLGKSRELVAEEWAIFDFEGFGDYRVGEYENLETLLELAHNIEEEGESYLAWLSICDEEERDLESYRERYLGEWESLRDYVEEWLEETGTYSELESALKPTYPPNATGPLEWLIPYIDTEAIARTWKHEGYHLVRYNGSGHLFYTL